MKKNDYISEDVKMAFSMTEAEFMDFLRRLHLKLEVLLSRGLV